VSVDTKANDMNAFADLKRKKENGIVTTTHLVLILSSFHSNVFFSFLFNILPMTYYKNLDTLLSRKALFVYMNSKEYQENFFVHVNSKEYHM